MCNLRFIIFIFFISVQLTLLGQAENTLTVIGFGEGTSQVQATNAALRQCIEKTFGVFVTTNSKVVNDQLVNDEIATIASGNIVSYDVIEQLLKNEIYTVTVSAVVSPENIVKTFKSKGFSFEINGNVISENIRKEQFYKEQEPIIIYQFLNKYKYFSIFDTFYLRVGEPFKARTELAFYKDERGIRPRQVVSDIFYGNFAKSNIDNLLPNNSFYNGYASGEPLNKWLSIDGSNVRKESWPGSIINQSVPTYIIPIVYEPNYSLDNAFKLSKILREFLNKISIKDNSYDSKYGETYTANLYLINGSENRSGKINRVSISNEKFKLRNKRSLSIIANFAKIMGQKVNPDCLDLVNNDIKFELNSGWFGQRHQNNTYFVNGGRYDIHLNLANYLSNGQWNSGLVRPLYYQPCLLLFHVSENELSMLKKLEFKWK
jgi:hypothetical protein